MKEKDSPFVRTFHVLTVAYARYLTGVKYFILRFGLQIFGENRKRIDSMNCGEFAKQTNEMFS